MGRGLQGARGGIEGPPVNEFALKTGKLTACPIILNPGALKPGVCPEVDPWEDWVLDGPSYGGKGS